MEFINNHINKIPYLLLFILLVLVIILIMNKLKKQNKDTYKGPDLLAKDPYSEGKIDLMTKDPVSTVKTEEIKTEIKHEENPLEKHLQREVSKPKEEKQEVINNAFDMEILDLPDISHKTQKFCPECGTPNDVLNKFCIACGYNFDE